MKTAEEWLHVDRFPCTDSAYANEEFESWVTQIQLDAIKEGMKFAAKICKAGVQEVTGTHWELRAITQQSNNMCESLSKEILADAKKRKELP